MKKKDSTMFDILDDNIGEETKKIALGKIKKSPLLNELSEWFENKYSVKLLNLEYTGLKHDPNRHRLRVILATTQDYNKMHLPRRREMDDSQPIEEYQKQIIAEFRQLAIKYKYSKESELEDMFVFYVDFAEEAKTQANKKAIEEAEIFIKNKYSSVWRVVRVFSKVVVFFYSNQDILDNGKTGTINKIKDDYYLILKRYDDLNYFNPENMVIKFDSKEYLDKKFDGQLQFYFNDETI